MKASTTTFTLALSAAIGAAGIAHAAGNPFALNALSQGYMVAAADKAQDGKCGGAKNDAKAMGEGMKDAKAKDGEGKCGGAKSATAKEEVKVVKAKDGKCGEGKCGGAKK